MKMGHGDEMDSRDVKEVERIKIYWSSGKAKSK
jgi:hypothetical protein